MASKVPEQRLQTAILDYVEAFRPVWLHSAVSGRARVLRFVGPELAQVFHEAGLTTQTGRRVVSFWDRLAAMARGLRGDRNVLVGRKGERLSLRYELNRTGKRARWISIESNEDGYDILSAVDTGQDARLLIEVKATEGGNSSRFFITRYEWRVAREAANHAFHLWNVSGEVPELALVTAEEIKCHIPMDQGEGRWQHVSLPFAMFSDRFSPQSFASHTGDLG